MSNLFLTREELHTLTGRKMKSKQIETLRHMGLPFWVNACGHPVVSVAAVEGRRADVSKQAAPTWEPPPR